MAVNPDGEGQHTPQELRFGVRACCLGLALAYVLVFPLKWFGLMPDHLTWLGLTLAPAAYSGRWFRCSQGFFGLRNRWWLLFVPVGLFLAVLIGLNIARLGR